MPPSHGLTGFVAIKAGAKKRRLARCRRQQKRASGNRPGCEQVCGAGPQGAKTHPATARFLPLRPAACARFRRVSLHFQEQIQGPKNGPIARFQGLCCYQTDSKKGFQTPGGKRRAVLAIRSCARACRPGRGAAAGCPIGLAWRHQRPEGAASRRRRRAARAPRAGHSRPGG